MVGTVTLELEIEQLFLDSILDQNARDSAARAPGFHFSGLSYDCLRNIQYAVQVSQSGPVGNEPTKPEEEIDMEGILRMWIGTQLHLTPMTPEHEWPLYLEIDVDGKPVGVHGRVDEIYRSEEGPVVIVDKKFTSTVPKTPNEHYMTQVSYYAGVFAHQTGAKVTHGALLYFSPFVQGKKQDGSAMYGSKERMRVFVFPVDTDKAWNELHEKVRAVQRAINAGTVIDRTTGWLCRYCKWKGQCEALSGPVHMNGNQKLLKDG